MNKTYWLEKWKEHMCFKFNSIDCFPKELDCSDCLYNANYNIINIEECPI